MNYNWALQNGGEGCFPQDFNDYDYGENHKPSIGDEIEADNGYYFSSGIVIGIIRNKAGVPVCYKVWSTSADNGNDNCSAKDKAIYDYIQSKDVTLCEPCGSSKWSLSRIGYEWVDGDDADDGHYYNKETGDVIWR